MKHFPSQRLQYTLLISTLLTLPVLAGQKPKKPSPHGTPKTSRDARYEPSKTEFDCIIHMLGATTLAQAKARRALCKDSFVVRAYYSSLLVQLQAPGADEEIIRSLPRNAAQMDGLYPYGSASYTHPPSSIDAYYRYYNSVFRVAASRPSLLPTIFAIADRFGSTNPDNIEERGSFCDELRKIYTRIPGAYMRAVRKTKNEKYRRAALGCRRPGAP